MNNLLAKFKTAQQTTYSKALQEIRNGQKQTHWMWFIFPQVAGLGKSAKAKEYGIKNIEEAKFYLLDDILGQRLVELNSILAYEVNNRTVEDIFGFPDYLKWHSSLTLFNVVVNTNEEFKTNGKYNCFVDALYKYYEGKTDRFTMEILTSKSSA